MISLKDKSKKSVNKDEQRFFLIVNIFAIIAGFYSGMYAFRFGILSDVKQHAKAVQHDPSQYFKYITSESNNPIQDVNLDFKFKDHIKLSNQRSRFVYSIDHFFKGKQWKNRDNFYVNATLKFNENKYKVKAKLFGKNNDHFRHPYKWSYRIKVKEYIEDFKNGKFNLLQPNTRMFITDVLCNKVFDKYDILSLEYIPIHLKINDRSSDLYFVEDFFSKYLIERNGFRDSYIFTFSEIKHPSTNKLTKDQLIDIDVLRKDITIESSPILDKDKFDVFLALTFLAQNKHPFLNDNFHMFYNSVTNRVEPMVREVWFEKPLTINSVDDLKDALRRFIKDAKSNNTNLTAYFDDISNNIQSFEHVIDRVYNVANDIMTIRATKQWKALEETIYSRFPQGIYLCKNIDANIKKVLDLEMKPKLLLDKEMTVFTIDVDKKLESDLILDHTKLSITSGVTFDLNGNDLILESSSIEAISNDKTPIQIVNSSDRPSSIIVLKSKTPNIFRNVKFNGLSNFNRSYWHLPASITFYESDVHMDYVVFENNEVGDDYVNFFRCNNFELSNTHFKNVKADAIDSDFSNGVITNCSFDNVGNDAVDGSGSTIRISNCEFSDVEDKVISAGENSVIKISNSKIKDSEIAFVAKDDSSVIEANNTLSNNVLDYCIFNKKKEFNYGSVTTDKDLKLYNYLIEKGSKVFKDKKEVLNLKVVDSVKESLYGIEYGKKSN